jgi:hypothetical protein
MGFTKLDERILQSSIMAENPIIFKVWITLLAACESNGIAYVSAVYLSTICHLPLSKVKSSIERLESPDPHSRSLNEEGRRIRRVDGGYEIINYSIYRDFSLKDAEAERKRLYRHRNKECPDSLGHCPDTSASVSASASSSEFEDFWKAYPNKESKNDAYDAFRVLRKKESLETIAKAFNGYMDFLKDERVKNNFNRRPKNAATFLKKDRWREYLDYKYEPSL